MLQFESFQELLRMAGVFVLTWDNCEFGEAYKHRQVLITNMPWLAALARVCQGGHRHLKIGFDKDLRTEDVSAYSKGWCGEYARLSAAFVRSPADDKCVHCLPQGSSDTIYKRRETLRRCAERVQMDHCPG